MILKVPISFWHTPCLMFIVNRVVPFTRRFVMLRNMALTKLSSVLKVGLYSEEKSHEPATNFGKTQGRVDRQTQPPDQRHEPRKQANRPSRIPWVVHGVSTYRTRQIWHLYWMRQKHLNRKTHHQARSRPLYQMSKTIRKHDHKLTSPGPRKLKTKHLFTFERKEDPTITNEEPYK